MTVIVVKIAEKDGGILLPNTAITVSCSKLYEVFEKSVKSTNLNLSMDSIIEVRVRDNLSSQYIKAENTEMEITEIVETLGCKFIEYIILLTTPCNHLAASNHTACANPTRNTINAFSLLMQNNNTIMLPQKPKNEKLTGPQRLECDIIDCMSLQGYGWNNNSLDIGDFVVKTLTHTLWYIDHAHDKFKQNACPLPKTFTQFSGYNDYKKLPHKTPVITSEKLNDFSLDVTKALSFPSMLLSRHKELSADLELLLEYNCKYKKRLDKDNQRHRDSYQRDSSPKRSLQSDSFWCILHQVQSTM